MPDGTSYRIENVRRELLWLEGDLVKELDSHQKRQAAGWLMEEIETKLVGLEKICQKS